MAEARQIADLADSYSAGEIRLTVEQNVILPNVDEARVDALLAEPSLNGASRLSANPGHIVGNLVSCTYPPTRATRLCVASCCAT